MADSRLVKDVMVPAVQLKASARAGDALLTLDQKGVEYGVTTDESGKPLMIVTKEQLSTAEADDFIQTLTLNVPHPKPIEPDVRLSSIVQMLAESLTINIDFTGFIVQDQGKVLGVLLRETILEHAWSILFDKSNFAGLYLNDPRSRGNPIRGVPKRIVFECPICYKRTSVRWEDYDPNNPPTCNNNHLTQVMRPI